MRLSHPPEQQLDLAAGLLCGDFRPRMCGRGCDPRVPREQTRAIIDEENAKLRLVGQCTSLVLNGLPLTRYRRTASRLNSGANAFPLAR